MNNILTIYVDKLLFNFSKCVITLGNFDKNMNTFKLQKLPNKIKIIASICIFYTFTATAQQAPAPIEVPSDYSTIQGAIDAAQNGEAIHVKAGNYRENLIVADKVIELIGIEVPEATIIDGQHNGKCLKLRAADGSVVTGFSFPLRAGQIRILVDER